MTDLSVELRQGGMGTGHSRRLRRLDDKVPAVIYGAGKTPVSIAIEHRHIAKALASEAFYSQILTLEVSGVKEKVVLKALQRHPSKPKIMHADFLRVDAKEKLSMTLPIHFLNADTAPGVKLEGGVISHLANEIDVRCLPGDLPEFIAIDLAELKLDEAIHLSQVAAPNGVEFVALTREDDPALVRIHAPHGAQEPEEIEEGAPSAAEVPVISKGESEAEKGDKK